VDERTRESYDVLAEAYAERLADWLAGMPYDRAWLAAFAEQVTGPVLDVGCGTGIATAHLAGLGLDVSGVDLSRGMLRVARRERPGLRFTEASMTALPIADASLGGLVAWYSTIHVPDEALPGVFAEFRRVLAPGGVVALAFQVGDEPWPMAEAFGHPVGLVFRRRRPERVAELLTGAGLDVRATLTRAADPAERTPHGYLLARRPAAESSHP
jgi:ubiquinone/menaquinone biosynthesis C-methylase UbiE